FSTLTGVLEDVPEIILNLKKVRLKLHADSSRTLYLKAKKKGKVKAKDIQKDPAVEVVNPNLHIATLSDESKLEMEITVEAGRGYVASEQLKDGEKPVGTIFLDALFSPVSKVSYHVENTRVGQKTDYDKLTLEIWTDSSILPRDALSHAAKIIRDHMNLLISFDKEPEILEEKEDKEFEQKQTLLATRVEELELSVRASNCLESAKIETIGGLVQKSEKEMLDYRNFGKKSLQELKDILEKMEIQFGMDVKPYMEMKKET
ncbi:DNA-directed RNA polymerase subunit alpha, partial [candidate division TA06 bacterium]|nr:DNA-directed RNA polymerase subunit alpha [candidate division TA06 bacterium]